MFNEITVKVYLVTGLLDSGKTTFIKETLLVQDWIEDGNKLLICCEEGEETFEDALLREKNVFVDYVDDMDELTETFLKNCEDKYHPVQIVIECNGMWKIEEFLEKDFPDHWELHGIYAIADGSTLDIYWKNMRSILMEQMKISDYIIVNRSVNSETSREFRRCVKIQNPDAKIAFMNSEGNKISIDDGKMPFEFIEDTIVIEDDYYGLWYADAYEHPARYIDKYIEFKALAIVNRDIRNNMFIPVREIMTCCEDDIQYYGYPCYVKNIDEIPENQWVKIKAKFSCEQMQSSKKLQPVLHLIKMEIAKAPREPVAFLG